jgi:periplasmic protein TonB
MMKSVKIKKSRQNIIFAVAFSLAIHIAVAVPVFYKLSDNSTFSKSLNKINLVWVALETKNNAGSAEKVLRPVADISPNNTVQKTITKDAPEIREARQEVTETSTAASFSGAVILSGYDGSVAATVKEQVYNSSGSAPGETAKSLSAPGIADAYPLYRENVPPVYPEIARIRGYEGIVLVAAEILPDGSVGSMKIRKSSGHAILDQSAVKAVKPWKFEPARKSGKPFAVWVELPIKFVLQDDNSQS